MENYPTLDFIPESKGDFSLDANDKMMVTPDDWATTSVSGSLTVSDGQQDSDSMDDTGQTPGFEMLLGIFSLLIVVYIQRKKR